MTDASNCIDVSVLRVLLAGKAKVLVLDVRSPEEYADGHIESAMNVPVSELPAALAQLPAGREIVTVCGKGGGRSEEAARLLIEHGFKVVGSLCGGMWAWNRAEP